MFANQIGYRDYQSYLKSDHWQKINNEYFLSALPKYCYICDRVQNLLLHHESYDRLGQENLREDLVCLCSICHKKVHFDEYGEKIPLKREYLKERRLQLRRDYLHKHLKPSTFFTQLKRLVYRMFW